MLEHHQEHARRQLEGRLRQRGRAGRCEALPPMIRMGSDVADLDYLGRSDYKLLSLRLKQEWEHQGIQKTMPEEAPQNNRPRTGVQPKGRR